MNSKNLDIEQMRKAWIEMGKALDMQTPHFDPDNMNKMNTDLDKLRTRYMKGRDLSIVSAVIFPILLLCVPSLNDEHRLSLAITFAVLALGNAYVLHWFWKGIGKINPLTMSITQISSMAKHYKKCHLLYNLIALPITILFLGYFLFAANRSEDIVIEIIIGGIGGLYGLWKYLNDYRQLSK